jgi:hypothetical protein
MSVSAALCGAKLRDGNPCRSVATHDEFCAYHAALADELGSDVVTNGDQTKTRHARQRLPVIAESEPLELNPRMSKSPSAVRPALALRAAEELETIRRVSSRPRPAPAARVGRHALARVWQELPPADLRPRSRSEDQGDRDTAPRGPWSSRIKRLLPRDRRDDQERSVINRPAICKDG